MVLGISNSDVGDLDARPKVAGAEPRGEAPPAPGRSTSTEDVVAGMGRRLNLVEDSVQVALLQLDTSVLIVLPRDGGKGGKGSWELPSLRHEVGGVLTSGGFPHEVRTLPSSAGVEGSSFPVTLSYVCWKADLTELLPGAWIANLFATHAPGGDP